MTELPILLVFRAGPPPELLAELEVSGLLFRQANPQDAARSVSEGWAQVVVCERIPGWQALVTRIQAAGGGSVLFGNPPTADEGLNRGPEPLDLEAAREPEAVVGALLRTVARVQARKTTELMPDRLDERVRRAELVNRHAQSIASQIDLPRVVEEATDRARDLCDAAGASLMLVDPETGELRPVNVAAGAAGTEAVRLRMGEGLAGTVAQRARPMLVQDAGLFPDFASHRDLQTGFKTGSAIAVPLVVSGDVLGVLEAVREAGSPPFQPAHLDRLGDLAPHVAIAVHNARMQELVLRANAELEDKVRDRTAQIARVTREWEETFDAIDEPIALMDGFTIRRANRAYARRAGVPAQQLAGRRCHEVLSGRDTPCKECPLAGGPGAGGEMVSEVSLSVNAVHAVSAFRMRGAGGGGATMVLRYRDVSRERALQARLRESERMVAVGQLASGAAHEINNPLGFLISNLSGLESLVDDLYGSDSVKRDAAQMIREALQGAHRVGAIVKELRELSRLQIGRPQPCDVNASASRAARAELAEEQEAGRVCLDLQAETPALIAPLQLDQLLGKIFRNARQATRGTERIFIRTRDADAAVRIEIEDEGCGIKPEHLNRVFEPFFSTRGVGQGMGLGLTAAYGVAQRYGGKIEARSEPGRGAIFTVTLVAGRPALERDLELEAAAAG